MAVNKDNITSALRSVNYPGFGKDIVTLGAVDVIEIHGDQVYVGLKKIAADAPVLEKLYGEAREAVLKLNPSLTVTVGEGAPSPEKPKPKEKGDDPYVRNKIPGVRCIIPVVSGKGGVGKSTVAVNLAYTLAQLGHKTGLLDLDLFGPSVHRMLGATGRLQVEDNMIIPIEKDKLKLISVGMALEDDEALILRGPMVMKLLNQLMNQVNWGELDYLIVDMPPGTGDIPLSLTQQLAVTGAVVVTTPQDISLIDVRRAVAMFRQTDTYILGLVENMSYYVCEKCGDVAHIFGKGGGEREADKFNLPMIGQIPLVKSICEEADAGNPIFDRTKSPELSKVFEKLAQRVAGLAVAAEEFHTSAKYDMFSAPGKSS